MGSDIPGGRRRDLDRLRIAACLSTFCYHAVQVFDLNPYYHVKSDTLSPSIDVAARLLHAVRMPLFFFIAGMVGFLALRRYSDREFMRQRAVRLLPPFVLGILLLTPAVKYIEMLDGRSINWRGIIETGITVPDMATFLRRYYTQQRWFSWSHMWFPLYLFLLGGALLPLMRRLADPARAAPSAMVVYLLPLLPLAAIELTLRPFFPFHVPNLVWDWASVAVYAVVMVWGAALMRWPDLEAAVRRALPLTLALLAGGVAIYVSEPAWPLKGIGRAMTLWGALMLAVALGPWLARGRIPGETWLADAVLPLYVLHHVPLLVIAYAVQDMPWPVWQRWLVIVAGAFAVTVALYGALVRPFRWSRLAFGLPATARAAA